MTGSLCSAPAALPVLRGGGGRRGSRNREQTVLMGARAESSICPAQGSVMGITGQEQGLGRAGALLGQGHCWGSSDVQGAHDVARAGVFLCSGPAPALSTVRSRLAEAV